MKKRVLVVVGLLLVSVSGYSALYTENFSGYAIGASPANMTARSNALIVAGSGTTGSGNAVQLTDNSAVSTAAYVESNFAANEAGEYGAVSVSFDIYNNQLASSAGNLTFGIGSYSNNATYSMNANATRYFNLEFASATGTLTLRANGANLGSATYNLGSSNHIEVFVNDSETAGVGYIGGTLGTNSFAVYVNNSLVGVGVKGLGASALSVGESDGLGRFGFYSASTSINQFTIDNIVVNNLIPEPASVGLLLIGCVTVLFWRRRNR